MEAHLARAIETARAGHKEQARDLLVFILNEEPRNITAWKWFATVAQSEEEARQALNNVLLLDPTDGWAQRGLEALDARSGRQAAPQARPPRESSPRAAMALTVGLAILVVGLCVVGVVLATVGPNGEVSMLPLETAAAGNPGPGVGAGGDLAAPTLPPTWTPSAVPPPLPSVTPMPTLTSTPLPGPTVTKVPTPAVLDAPPDSQVDAVYADAPLDTSEPVVESQSVSYYTVTGSNAFEINQSILANGPKSAGFDAIAQIQYTIALHYALLQTTNSCSAEGAIAHLTMAFTYPQYEPSPGTPQEVLDQWDAFMVRVVRHEETHAQIARECAADMVSSFYTLQPAGTCSALQNSIEALQNAGDAECDARQFAFDEAEGGDSFP